MTALRDLAFVVVAAVRWALPVAACVVGANLLVDPAGRIGTRHVERDVAAAVLSGRDVMAPANVDDRRIQQMVIAGLRAVPDVVLVGGSRLMNLGRAAFPGATLLNHSVTRATVFDLMAVIDGYQRRGWMPARVVIGLEPWSLNAREADRSWVSIAGEARHWATSDGLPPDLVPDVSPAVERWKAAGSLSYFQWSVDEGLRRLGIFPAYPQYRRYADGHVEAPDWRASGRDQRLAAFRAGTPAMMDGFERVDAGRLRLIDRLIASAVSRGATVSIVLMPFEPASYAWLRTTPHGALVMAAESAFVALARARGVALGGSFDPAVAGCRGDEFYDALHAFDTCGYRVLASAPR